jgi:hypothetical protein
MSMPQLATVRRAYLRILELICFVLMAALAVVVVLGVTYRTLGAALVWYDEIASVLLAWLTYYGAALAAFRGGHIAVSSIVDAMPRPLRVAVTLFAEAGRWRVVTRPAVAITAPAGASATSRAVSSRRRESCRRSRASGCRRRLRPRLP